MSRLKDAQLQMVLGRLRSRHPDISDLIATDLGVTLMHHDSEIAEFVTDHFTHRGIAVLGVHDSFIIAEGYETELRHVMSEAFKAVTGFSNPRIDKKAKDYSTDEIIRPPQYNHLLRLYRISL